MQMIVEGLFLGLSTGAYCIGLCLTFFMPYLLAEGKPRLWENFKKISAFLLGRLIAYISFALIMGILGIRFKNIITEKFAHLSLILASILMLVYVLTHKFSELKFCSYFLKRLGLMRLPFFLGLFSGLSPCLPFVVGVTRLWTLKSVFAGTVLFAGFFLGTSVYMFPLLFVSFLNRMERAKMIGQIMTLLSGLWFLFVGIRGLTR